MLSESSFAALLRTLLLLALLLLGSRLTHAQTVTSGSRTTESEVRNHGTGVRFATACSRVRAALHGQGLPASFEVGAFHQVALGQVGSVQVEGLYYRQQTAAGTTTGLRVPALLVLNPFDNVSFHAGPQLQWCWRRAAAPATPVPDAGATYCAAAPLTAQLVLGGEARVECLRVGLRYALPLQALTDLPELGQELVAGWRAGQVQLALSVGF